MTDEQPTTLLEQAETDSDVALKTELDPNHNDDEVEVMLPTTIEKAEDDGLDRRDTSTMISDNSFWKYNSIRKRNQESNQHRPFAQEINLHKPLTFIDPAFEPPYNGNIAGKYRIGEGNDITPNLAKLSRLGREIKRVMSERTQPNDADEKSTMTRTKKMLISRLSRLKRSANHEANKIIFDGLEKERDELSRTIRLVKRRLEEGSKGESMTAFCMKLQKCHSAKVAGNWETYVNGQLAKSERAADSSDIENCSEMGSADDSDIEIESA